MRIGRFLTASFFTTASAILLGLPAAAQTPAAMNGDWDCSGPRTWPQQAQPGDQRNVPASFDRAEAETVAQPWAPRPSRQPWRPTCPPTPTPVVQPSGGAETGGGASQGVTFAGIGALAVAGSAGTMLFFYRRRDEIA